MSSKHIFSSSEGLVLKAQKGSVYLNPSLRLDPSSKTVYVHSPSLDTKVAVIAGGGAGHEPAHAGYTGKGMLSASVSGEIFASPSAKQIMRTIELAAFTTASPDNTTSESSDAIGRSKKDVLVVINNYTGDRLNFGLAIEKARRLGIELDSVVVADDVSLLGSEAASLVGPRGLGGNILVCKILGALAERGATLEETKKVGDAVVANLASIGVGLEHCHIPGRTPESIPPLGKDECEIGLGLHNEPGVMKYSLEDSSKLFARMIEKVLQSRGEDDPFVRQNDDETVLFVNNLGGMSQLEMAASLNDVLDQLHEHNISPLRIYLSSYMTSLNAVGFSLSILNLTRVKHTLRRDNLSFDPLDLLDDPTEAAAWVGVKNFWSAKGSREQKLTREDNAILPEVLNVPSESPNDDTDKDIWRTISPVSVKNAIIGACQAILVAEEELNGLDAVVGDGDCGTTFSAGARVILRGGLHNLDERSLSSLVQDIGNTLEGGMGGTAGALFAIFFTAWSNALQNVKSPQDIASSLSDALEALSAHTPAQPGDRTLVDALQPLVFCLYAGGTLGEAVLASREGAERTRDMKPRLGRAAYVGGSGDNLPADPGAVGIAIIVDGFWRGLNN